MRDPFNRARAMQSSGGAMPPAAPAAPLAAGPSMPPPPQPPQAISHVAKQLGIGHLNLSKDPVQARTQLMQHLQTKYGPNFAAHPEAKQMMDAFNAQSMGGQQDTSGMTTHEASSMKTLLGHP